MNRWVLQLPFFLGIIGIGISSLLGMTEYNPGNAQLIITLGVGSVYLFFVSSLLGFFSENVNFLEFIKGLVILVVTLGYIAVLSNYCDVAGAKIFTLLIIGFTSLALSFISVGLRKDTSIEQWQKQNRKKIFGF